MDLIIFADSLYHLVPVTKTMLSEISISKGVDCMELCDVIRENFTTYISNKNIHIINGSKNLFIGCICGVEVPQ